MEKFLAFVAFIAVACGTSLASPSINTVIPKKDSEDGCYVISNAGELYGFAALVQGGNYGPNGKYITELGACAKLTADIVLNENVLKTKDGKSNVDTDGKYIGKTIANDWTPMRQFYGKFYGQGHVIRGLYVNEPTSSEIGLFGQLSLQSGNISATVIIDGLGIEDSYFNGKQDVGALVGISKSSSRTLLLSITNSYVNAYVKGSKYVGGMIGRLNGVASLNMENSYVSCTMDGEYADSTGTVYGVADIVSLKSFTSTVSMDNVYVPKGDIMVGHILEQSADKAPEILKKNTYWRSSEDFAGGLVAVSLHGFVSESAIDDNHLVNASVWGQDVLNGVPFPDFSGKIAASNVREFTLMKGDSSLGAFYCENGVECKLPKSAKGGFEIFAWYEQADFSGSPIVKVSRSMSSKTLFAKWMKADDEGCYEISDIASLYNFRDIVNGANGMTRNQYACGKLVADIFVNENVLKTSGGVSNVSAEGVYTGATDNLKTWTPIGNDIGYPFLGKFNGRGFKISGLYFSGADVDYVGLFGGAGYSGKEAVIDSVVVEDSYFSAKNSVGGIVAISKGKTTISNSSFDGFLMGGFYVGGICGQSNSGSLVISGDMAKGSVNGSTYVGGLVGQPVNETSVEDSHFEGSVSGKSYVGGLVGSFSAESSILNSFAHADVKGAGESVGGLVGKSSKKLTVSNSRFEGKVDGTSAKYVGGLVGFAEKGLTLSKVSSKGEVTGVFSVGGLVGYAKDVLSITQSESSCMVTGSEEGAGGLVGYTASGAVISASRYEGALSGKNYVGGLIGNVTKSGTVETIIEIKESSSKGEVAGVSGVGGLVGFSSSLDSIFVLNSYSVSNVVGQSSYIGGFFGGSRVTVLANSYFGGTISGAQYCGIVVGDNAKKLIFENVFYLKNEKVRIIGSDVASTDTNSMIGVTSDELANGSVAVRLHDYENAERSVNGKLWGQNTVASGDVAADSCPSIKDGKIIFPLTAELNGGNLKVPMATGYTYGVPYTFPTPVREGYEFLGWFTDEIIAGGTNVKGTSATTAGPMKVVANWIKKDADGCYEIADAASLYNFAAIVNGSNGVPQRRAACGFLTANITVNQNVLKTSDGVSAEGVYTGAKDNLKTWTPIGFNRNGSYTGRFHGHGHTISGLFFKDGGISYVGLFGYVGYAAMTSVTIDSVGVEDSYFMGDYGVGGIVGVAEGEMRVLGSHFDGVVTAINYNAGGLVGISSGITTIENSYSSGVVGGRSGYVGGLLGHAESTLSIKGSYSTSRVSGSECYVGGLVGLTESKASITASYYKGEVDVEEAHAGGLVGFATKSLVIENSYVVGNVAGNEYDIGGLVGHAGSDLTVTNSFALAYVDGESHVGGLVGFVGDEGSIAFTLTNSFYLKNGKDAVGVAVQNGAIAATADEFADGSVGICLNQFESEDKTVNGNIWGQNIGSDDYPTFVPSGMGNVVFAIVAELNGGSLADEAMTGYSYGSEYAFPTPVREGYNFEGWFTDAKFAEASKITKIPATNIGSVKVYAKWSILQFVITVAANDNDMGSVTGAGTFDYGKEITLKAIAKAGYQFSDWADDAKASAERTVTVTEAKTYVANFKALPESSSSSDEPSSSEKVAPVSSSSEANGDDSSKSRSSSVKSSSSNRRNGKSSDSRTAAVLALAQMPQFSVAVANRMIQVDGVAMGSRVALLDMQGRVLAESIAPASNFTIEAPRAGMCLVRIAGVTKVLQVK